MATAHWRSQIIDTHCHFWDLKKFDYPWPTPDLSIYQNRLPDDLWKAMHSTPETDIIFVQCLNNSSEEAEWVSEMAGSHPRIRGIVAGLDPSDAQFGEKLSTLKENIPELVGIRHILDLEGADYLQSHMDAIAENINELHQHNLTFDLLLRPPLLNDAITLASKVTNTKMVIDHIAKPFIKDHILNPWKEQVSLLAQHSNIHCKLSGMVTEADLNNWKSEDIREYVDHVVKEFGMDRIMYGSDWPVCQLARADYNCVLNTLVELLKERDESDLRKIFCTNGRNFYNITQK